MREASYGIFPREESIAKIQEEARTGQMDDGKIFMLPLEKVMRIRTGESGKHVI